MKRDPIFIHSLFRTGSTYFWNKFRKINTFCCYYEPFHQILIKLTIENPTAFPYDKQATDAIHHPPLNQHYMFEYQGLLRNHQTGLPFFKKEFSFDYFCETEDKPDVRTYIDFLISKSGERTPFLQFNRSALRTKWFRKTYPQSLNVFLVRNPRDQWQSCVSLAKENKDYIFLVMDLLVSGVNMHKPCFLQLSSHIPLIEYHSDTFDDEELVYRHLLEAYSLKEMYTIFYHIWLNAFIHNVLFSDFLVYIDQLSKNLSYRERIQRLFAEYPVDELDFTDARITTYTEYALESIIMDKIEKETQKRLFQSLSEDDRNAFFSSLSEEDMTYFDFDRNAPLDLPETVDSNNTIDKISNDKYRDVIQILGNEIVLQNTILKSLEVEKQQGDQRIENLCGQIFEKEQELAQKTALLQRQEEQIVQKTALLQRQEEQIVQMDRQLLENEQAIEHQRRNVIEKSCLIDNLNRQISEMDFSIHAIYKSYSYRLGHFFLSPIIFSKKVIFIIKHFFRL